MPQSYRCYSLGGTAPPALTSCYRERGVFRRPVSIRFSTASITALITSQNRACHLARNMPLTTAPPVVVINNRNCIVTPAVSTKEGSLRKTDSTCLFHRFTLWTAECPYILWTQLFSTLVNCIVVGVSYYSVGLRCQWKPWSQHWLLMLVGRG